MTGDDVARRNEFESAGNVRGHLRVGEVANDPAHSRRFEVVRSHDRARDGDHDILAVDRRLQTLVLDGCFRSFVGQHPRERIEWVALVARTIGVMTNRAERPRDHGPRDAGVGGSSQDIAGAEYIGLVDLALIAGGDGDSGRAVKNAGTAPHCNFERRQIANVSDRALDVQAVDGSCVVVGPQQDSDPVAFQKELPDEVCTQMSGGAGDKGYGGTSHGLWEVRSLHRNTSPLLCTPMTAARRLPAAAMLIGLPAITWYSWLCLTFFDGALVPPAAWLRTHRFVDVLPQLTVTSVGLYLAWLALQATLYVILPGRLIEGTVLADGSRLIYRMNGWLAFGCTVVIVGAASWFGWIPAAVGYDEFSGLLTTATIAAFAVAGIAYAKGEPSTHRTNALANYVMGISLNPRVHEFDLKFFCESRPGLMLWVVLNGSCVAKQYELNGFVTTPMLLVNAFQLLYVADYFVHEDAILTTWDVKHERFGWMLCWGCLVWVPFMYSIQAHYLVKHTHELSAAAIAALVVLNLTGYAIFRSANLQKHRFRQDPDRRIWGQAAEYIRTGSGALLLTSGWWGMARHMNYFGDLLMGLAWCLPTGFAHPLPYFYFVYFVVLLIHRERRDDRMCLQKYGQDWEAYCRKVHWRIVPGLY